jgi:hypothetical protein
MKLFSKNKQYFRNKKYSILSASHYVQLASNLCSAARTPLLP